MGVSRPIADSIGMCLDIGTVTTLNNWMALPRIIMRRINGARKKIPPNTVILNKRINFFMLPPRKNLPYWTLYNCLKEKNYFKIYLDTINYT